MLAIRAKRIAHGRAAIRSAGSEPGAVPAPLLNVCLVLLVINAAFFPAAILAHWWIFDENGLGMISAGA